ncbi:MAG TPA: competence/damage-inducible protein A, partial [Rhodothermales bacterium]|nr:competence/damage-inducible protein A [Rhodothermales bacterium]
MTAAFLTVGDELLIGQTVNTNAAWLAARFNAEGVDVVRMETVGDDAGAIAAALARALEAADIVVMTGGLGPTRDDITKRTVADALGLRLVRDEGVIRDVEAYFARRGRPMDPVNLPIGDVPEGFEVLPNPVGTAPGLWGEVTDSAGRPRVVVMMPGVPYEMKQITETAVEPRLAARRDGVVLHRTLLTAGEGETMIAERLGDLDDLLGDALTLAFLPELGTVRLRITAKGADRAAAEAALDRAEGLMRERLGHRVAGEGTDTLEQALGRALVEKGLTLAVAESCTGGAVAARLTAVAGASRYFLGGVVAYSNEAKEALLGVPHDLLEEHGAVSEPVARAMAEGARRAFGTDLAVATTGVAGPTGGSEEKPVGTVWIAVADAAGTRAACLRFTNDRTLNIGLAAS